MCRSFPIQNVESKCGDAGFGRFRSFSNQTLSLLNAIPSARLPKDELEVWTKKPSKPEPLANIEHQQENRHHSKLDVHIRTISNSSSLPWELGLSSCKHCSIADRINATRQHNSDHVRLMHQDEIPWIAIFYGLAAVDISTSTSLNNRQLLLLGHHIPWKSGQNVVVGTTVCPANNNIEMPSLGLTSSMWADDS